MVTNSLVFVKAVSRSRANTFNRTLCCKVCRSKRFSGATKARREPVGQTAEMLAFHNEAFRQLGLTPEEKLGAVRGGILGVLTNGRMTRERQIEQAVITAMIRIERAELY